jgi:hypothetical protein
VFAHLKYSVGCYCSEASAYTKHLLTGAVVRLVYDREHRDRYGRWLASVSKVSRLVWVVADATRWVGNATPPAREVQRVQEVVR